MYCSLVVCLVLWAVGAWFHQGLNLWSRGSCGDMDQIGLCYGGHVLLTLECLYYQQWIGFTWEVMGFGSFLLVNIVFKMITLFFL